MFVREVPLHPRPQLARCAWTDLRGPWDFAYDDDDVGRRQGWPGRDDVFDRTIQVPFPPESPASGIGDPSFHPIVWYRRTFTIPPDRPAARLLLHCGAIDYDAHVWVNGRLVVRHQGGHTPFSAEISDALSEEAEQSIVIRAEDDPFDLAQPRGKQDWQAEPHAIWYHRTTGVWQPIWLEEVSDTFITDVRWTPDLDRRVLGLAVELNRRPPTDTRVAVRLELHGAVLVDDSYLITDSVFERQIGLDSGRINMSGSKVLWHPEHPNLIDATLTVIEDGRPVDEVLSYAGLRQVSVASGKFILNGRQYYLRLALEQGYWPESHLAAPSDAALRREVELARELGFNGIRIHQKVEDPRFLYWCDRLGLLVWGEMANAYVFSRPGVERLTSEWLEVLRRNYSHPCIVAWVPFNESWGVPNLPGDPAQREFVRALYHLTKSIDPTRPVIANDGWEYLCGDILSIHDYTFSGDAIRARYRGGPELSHTLDQVQPAHRFVRLTTADTDGTPIMLTEFGGIGYRPEQNTPWYGYGAVADEKAYLEKYRELVDAVLDCESIAGFCYTQLTDTCQETNGLLTADRRPKLDVRSVRAINSRSAAAVVGDLVAQQQQTAKLPSGDAVPEDVPS